MQLPQSICWFGEETDHLKWKYLIWEARKGNNPGLLLDRQCLADSMAAELLSACTGTQAGETCLQACPTLPRI